jgi:hypothetical protein
MGKSHDFTNIHWGQEFALDVPLENVQGIATGQGTLKSGDRIVLCIQCRVDEVEYYINAPEMWQAKISVERPISLETITAHKPLQRVKRLVAHFRNALGRSSQTLAHPADHPLHVKSSNSCDQAS